MIKCAYYFAAMLLMSSAAFAKTERTWQIGPFVRVDQVNPIIKPEGRSTFLCPIQNKVISNHSAISGREI